MATVVRLTPPQTVTCGGYTLDSFVIELSDAALDFRFQLGDGYDIFWALPAAAEDRLRLFHMDNAAYDPAPIRGQSDYAAFFSVLVS